MSENFETQFFATRHSKKPKGEDLPSQEYPGLSESGVELAKGERAEEIFEMLKNQQEGTIVLLAAGSDMIRTKSTDKAYGEGLKELAGQNEETDILVLDQEDVDKAGAVIEGENEKNSISQRIQAITEIIEANPDKKIVITAPLFIKEFSLGEGKRANEEGVLEDRGRWTDKAGSLNEYTNKLLAENNNNELEALKAWISSEGKDSDGNQVGPNPTEVAKDQLAGIKRLAEFAGKFVEGRPVIIGGAGHSWNADVLAVYLVNNGKVDLEGFEKIGGSMIKETQMMRVGKNEEDESCLFYNDKEFSLSGENLQDNK